MFVSYFNFLRELGSKLSPVNQGSLRADWASILLSQGHPAEKIAKTLQIFSEGVKKVTPSDPAKARCSYSMTVYKKERGARGGGGKRGLN